MAIRFHTCSVLGCFSIFLLQGRIHPSLNSLRGNSVEPGQGDSPLRFMNKNYKNISILGTHKLAKSYFQVLKNSDLVYENLSLVETPTRFLLDYAKEKSSHDPQNIFIPDHTAKHVMLSVFLERAKELFPDKKIALSPFEAEFHPPFVHKSDGDALWAISHATWTCPPDCDEPEICPHIRDKRDWDFFVSLKNLLDKKENKDTLVLRYGCEPLYQHISFLPLEKVVEDLKIFEEKVKQKNDLTVIVATHSRCHGIIGQFWITG